MTLPPPPPDYTSRVPRQMEPPRLFRLGLDAFGREFWCAEEAAGPLVALLGAAERDDVPLLLISGFRSVERQAQIIVSKLAAGRLLADILRENAYPGFSEHHTGRAVDFGSPNCEHLTEAFAATREFVWLSVNAHRFGFILSYPRDNRHGIMYEPWHWCYQRP